MNVLDFFLPEGELNPDWFPDVNAEQLVGHKVGEAKNDRRITALPSAEARDRATEAYVYWKAYAHIYRRKSDDPNAWSAEGQGSEQNSNRQIARWREMADEKKREFDAYVDEDRTGARRPGTVSIPSRSGYA